jgi:hypothetical protein
MWLDRYAMVGVRLAGPSDDRAVHGDFVCAIRLVEKGSQKAETPQLQGQAGISIRRVTF